MRVLSRHAAVSVTTEVLVFLRIPRYLAKIYSKVGRSFGIKAIFGAYSILPAKIEQKVGRVSWNFGNGSENRNPERHKKINNAKILFVVYIILLQNSRKDLF